MVDFLSMSCIHPLKIGLFVWNDLTPSSNIAIAPLFHSETMNPLPLCTIEENEDIVFGDSDPLAIYSPLHSRTQSPVAIEGTPSPSAASSVSSTSSSVIVPASNLTTNDSSTNANCPKDQEERSEKDTMNNSEIVDEDKLLLEPISAFSGLSPVSKAKKRTRTSDTHPGVVSPTTNKEVKSANDMSCNNNVRTNKDVAELLFERQRSILHKSSKPIRQAAAMEESSAQPLPTMEQIDNHISQDYFMDGKELDRNVVIDYATNRSYVYTTDLGGAFQLPEFLFLDVPNSVYAARSCGQYITNKLVMDLLSIAAQGANVIQKDILDDLVKNTNKSVYGVHNIFVPSSPDQGHENNNMSSMTDIPVQAISARFRLRFLQQGTQLHRMLCQNFMNGNKCQRGIMVFIPVMKENTPAEAFWGALEGIERIPEDDRDISNAKLDKWCIRIARQHGTYRGKVSIHFDCFKSMEYNIFSSYSILKSSFLATINPIHRTPRRWVWLTVASMVHTPTPAVVIRRSCRLLANR